MVPQIEKTVSLVSELAEAVAQEKLLLEECLELFRMISILEVILIICTYMSLHKLTRKQ